MKTLGQYIRCAMVEFDYTDSPAGEFVPALLLPFGSKALAGSTVITTVSNAAGTDVVNFGIASDPDRNVDAVNFKAAATTVFTALTLVDGETLGFSRELGGANGTAGKGYLFVYYVVQDVNDFNVGSPPRTADLNGST